jgi:hypothetical protein
MAITKSKRERRKNIPAHQYMEKNVNVLSIQILATAETRFGLGM